MDRGRRLEPPDPVARRGVEGDEPAVVGADIDLAPPHRRRRVDVRAGPLSPEEAPAPGAEGVERAVRVPDEDPAVRDRRRRVEVLAPPEPRERPRPPAEPSGPGVESVEAAAVGAEVDPPVRECGRAVHLAVGGERPARFPGVDVDRVELVIPRARVQRLTDHERRGLERASPVAPDDLAGTGGHRRDHPGLAARVAVARKRLHPRVVDDPVGDGRRRGRAVVEAPLPDDLPRPVVDREEASALLGDVEPPVRDRGRELEDVARLERPAEPVGRAELEVRSRVRPLHAEPVRRPRKSQHDASGARRVRRLRGLRRHELHRRRSALVLDRALLVQPDAGQEPGDERRRRDAAEREETVAGHRRRTTTRAVSRRPETSTTSG